MNTKILSLCLIIAFASASDGNANPRTSPKRIEIAVTENGFEPASIAVQKGVSTTLVFTRTTDKTCVKQVVVQVSDADTIRRALPLNTPVAIDATFPKAGKLEYACGMNMITGVVLVR